MNDSVLGRLQTIIERLHGSHIGLDVRSYLIGDQVRREIPGAHEGLVEQLFVREEGESMELALYLDAQVVAQLAGDDPLIHLHSGNLEPCCIALEGISHFVFVAWRASAGRSVSALELEIQAEVDKFAAAWLLLQDQGSPLANSAKPLLHLMFQAFELREAVPDSEVERYQIASRVAQRFCSLLASRFGSDHSGSRIERAVQRFARQDIAEKLRAA